MEPQLLKPRMGAILEANIVSKRPSGGKTRGGATRRRAASEADCFRLITEAFYEPYVSLGSLAKELELDTSTVKRLLNGLRQDRIILGRAGSLTVAPSEIINSERRFCGAVVGVNTDVPGLAALERDGADPRYSTEAGLLENICDCLPREGRYRGTVLVDRGHIVMGRPEFAIVLTVYAVSPKALFAFVREGVEKSLGVMRTESLLIDSSQLRPFERPRPPSEKQRTRPGV